MQIGHGEADDDEDGRVQGGGGAGTGGRRGRGSSVNGDELKWGEMRSAEGGVQWVAKEIIEEREWAEMQYPGGMVGRDAGRGGCGGGGGGGRGVGGIIL